MKTLKTLIITTKQADECYSRIRASWLTNSKGYRVPIADAQLARPDLQFPINTVRVAENDDYRVVLPTCVNPDSPLDDRIEYVLSLICAISKQFQISRDDLYVMIHSGDLFDTHDANRTTGPLYFDDIYATPRRIEILKHIVKEDNLYQFRHDSRISDFLLSSNNGNISTLCESIINKIEKR